MTVFTVDSVDQLSSALKIAVAGDEVKLKSGEYSGIKISGMNFGSGISISSADSENPAKIVSFSIKSSSGISFSDVEMTPKTDGGNYSLSVNASNNISFDHVKVSGPEGSAGYDITPFIIRNSTNVSVTNSEFTHLWHGINLLDNTGVTVGDNYFHDIRTDGVRGGGNSDMTINNNYFTDFHPIAGDHPDAIQLWTGNTTASAHDIVISDNVVYAGTGEAIQGIFVRDQVGSLPYQNVTVTGNVVVGGLGNGIALDHIAGGTVNGNLVAGLGDSTSWLRVQNSSDVTVSDNSATTYNMDDASNTHVLSHDNAQLAPIYDGGVAFAEKYGDHIASLIPGGWLTADDLVSATSAQYAAKLAALPPVTIIAGTDGNDRLTVTNIGDCEVQGGAGNDTLTGGLGHNTLVGGIGDDTYYVKGAGDVVVEGVDGGNDAVYASIDYTLTANVETLRMTGEGLTGTGNELDNRIIGSNGIDHLYGMGGNDVIQGQDGDDVIYGGDGDDTIRGDDGNDTLFGDDGNDKLYGGAGNDVINGGAGNDTIEGGAGVDILTGGAGKDVFIFRAGDLDGTSKANPEIITDFSKADGERINLSNIDAKIATAADDPFTFIGTKAFSGKAGELHYEVQDGHAFVSGDVNGDGIADFTIKLLGVTSLAAGDFVL
ncbi:right-handed parallel beta-helix repeat-containing protein [Novosphingobium sp. UBA1939]|uniref:right-handed parallel beta-helix repeat-containing protein n=1 Tax=Novosphingobium sp. UBA1939 TaxID=1946982 RepID=UPI0025F88F1D|nr:right-handed parallel beta-helix repeat-containing protein [Novosphingobium sp. UBA1939]